MTGKLIAVGVALGFAVLAAFAGWQNSEREYQQQRPMDNYIQPAPNWNYFNQQHDQYVATLNSLINKGENINMSNRCRRIAAEYNKYSARISPEKLGALPNYLSEGAC